MHSAAFFTALVAIPAIVVMLDLFDRHATRRARYGGQGPRGATLLFLLAVLAVYALVQYGGLALAPKLEQTESGLRSLLAKAFGLPLSGRPLSLPAAVCLGAVMFYLGGLLDYLFHRFVSHSRPLWFTHEYHHLPNQVFALMPGLAARPFSVVATWPVTAGTLLLGYAALAVCGQPLASLAPLKFLVLLHVAVLTTSHSSCLRRWWAVHHALKWAAVTTPQEHVLHHSVSLVGNYGNFTTLWDRLFGTYLDPTREEHQDVALGLPYDQDFLGALTLGRLKLPPRWRERFQVGRYCNLHDPPQGETAHPSAAGR